VMPTISRRWITRTTADGLLEHPPVDYLNSTPDRGGLLERRHRPFERCGATWPSAGQDTAFIQTRSASRRSASSVRASHSSATETRLRPYGTTQRNLARRRAITASASSGTSGETAPSRTDSISSRAPSSASRCMWPSTSNVDVLTHVVLSMAPRLFELHRCASSRKQLLRSTPLVHLCRRGDRFRRAEPQPGNREPGKPRLKVVWPTR
jgi:hypothetical protein